ncbi:glycosyltransferase [Candidatus Microgenomates bacterium]|nr:glycosyltransferase [Candidatus Microgenomates bacterium]
MISVIIATKNEEKNIARLLESIKNQNYKDIEVIVVDNNSTDKTIQISKTYTNKVFLKGPERSVQRNFGVSKAKGKYVLILDGDMELTPNVLKNVLENLGENKAMVIPERTVGTGFMASVRKFEREMYMGDPTVEVARFFEKKVFEEFEGYDPNLTGAEDYDLPKRISDKYSIGRSSEYILHHETGLTLSKQLQKKFYYAQKSALYAQKHPDLISKQGILIWRKAYIRHWKKFITNPLMGIALLFTRTLETIAATLGFIKAVGIIGFFKTVIQMFKHL